MYGYIQKNRGMEGTGIGELRNGEAGNRGTGNGGQGIGE